MKYRAWLVLDCCDSGMLFILWCTGITVFAGTYIKLLNIYLSDVERNSLILGKVDKKTNMWPLLK